MKNDLLLHDQEVISGSRDKLEQELKDLGQRIDSMDDFSKQRISQFHAEIASQNDNISEFNVVRQVGLCI